MIAPDPPSTTARPAGEEAEEAEEEAQGEHAHHLSRPRPCLDPMDPLNNWLGSLPVGCRR